jgi:hypothetical protein
MPETQPSRPRPASVPTVEPMYSLGSELDRYTFMVTNAPTPKTAWMQDKPKDVMPSVRIAFDGSLVIRAITKHFTTTQIANINVVLKDIFKTFPVGLFYRPTRDRTEFYVMF